MNTKLMLVITSLVTGFLTHWLLGVASELSMDPAHHYAGWYVTAIVTAVWFAMCWSADSMDAADKQYLKDNIPQDFDEWLESPDPTGQYECTEDWVYAYASETGATMELDFDLERFQEAQYDNYLRAFMHYTYGV